MAKNLTSILKKIVLLKSHKLSKFTIQKSGNPISGCHFFYALYYFYFACYHIYHLRATDYDIYIPQSAHSPTSSPHPPPYFCHVRRWCIRLFISYGHMRGLAACSHEVECSPQVAGKGYMYRFRHQWVQCPRGLFCPESFLVLPCSIRTAATCCIWSILSINNHKSDSVVTQKKGSLCRLPYKYDKKKNYCLVNLRVATTSPFEFISLTK